MTEEMYNKWLEALESGKYTQGVGYLKKSAVDVEGTEHTSYCCLGVLCDLIDPNGWNDSSDSRMRKSYPNTPFPWRFNPEIYGDGVETQLPPALIKKYFAKYEAQYQKHVRNEGTAGPTLLHDLMNLNDGHNNFDQVIEEIKRRKDEIVDE